MGLPRSSGGEARFSTYVEGLTSVIGHADRAKPLRDYCLGLMMPCERKSVEPMAAITAPERTAAQHQSLLHFVGEGKWSDEKVLAKVRELVLPKMERHGQIEAWIIDDTGFPKCPSEEFLSPLNHLDSMEPILIRGGASIVDGQEPGEVRPRSLEISERPD